MATSENGKSDTISAIIVMVTGNEGVDFSDFCGQLLENCMDCSHELISLSGPKGFSASWCALRYLTTQIAGYPSIIHFTSYAYAMSLQPGGC